MKVLAIIPARHGSKGIKNKNLLKLYGKHLFELCIDCAEKAGIDYVVTSDDAKIISVCNAKNYQFNRRPIEISTDNVAMLDVVRYIASLFGEYDTFLILQPTSPFRKSCDINKAINLLEKNKKIDCVVSITQVNHKYHPSKLMQKRNDQVYGGLNFSNRQKIMSQYFYRNGLIYLAKRKNLKTGLIVGNIGFILTEPERAIDIDTQFDYEFAKWISKKLSI